VTRKTRGNTVPIAVRLAAVLVAVALVSVSVFALIVFFVDRADVRAAAVREEQATVAAITEVATNAYRHSGSWEGADVSAIDVLAGNAHLGVRLRSMDGAVLAEQTGPPDRPAETRTTPIVVNGATVGTLTVVYRSQPLSAADQRLRRALERSVLAAAGVAAAVALGCALLVARPLTRPLRQLTEAVRRHGAGERPGPEPPHPGPGELGELSHAFYTLLDGLDRHERLRREMVADIAHELRTPIAVLQGETEAILDGVTELTPAAAASLHEEILRLARLVEDLQTLAAAQAAGLNLRAERLDLSEVAAVAGAAQQRARHDAGLTCETDLTSVAVNGDPLRLHQVVTNLLTNAIKYTPPGGQVRLTVGAVGTNAVLEIQDTGPGIPANELPHIFERFHRGDHDNVPGSGIGLAVTAELVAAHHGTIEITSPPLGGTRATVRLPLAR
jgi:two-component system, OmpR family, sensor histidine kinase BaeS